MISRCYSVKEHERSPTYKDCCVCEDWLLFSNFKTWMESQDGFENMQLDKDLLFKGNKLYSPETCVLVSGKLNSFVTESDNIRGDCMLGVSWCKQDGKYQAVCCDYFTGKRKWLGYHDTEISAHLAWKEFKHELACKIAEQEVTDVRLKEALRKRYL